MSAAASLSNSPSPFYRDGRLAPALPGTQRLSATEILRRLLEDAIKVPVGFPEPPQWSNELGVWFDRAKRVLAETYFPDTDDWAQRNSRTESKEWPGPGTIQGPRTAKLDITYDYSFGYSYPYGSGTCRSGPNGPPKNEDYPRERTDTWTDVDSWSVSIRNTKAQAVCGSSPTEPQTVVYRKVTVVQGGYPYVTENSRANGTYTVGPGQQPRTEYGNGALISVKASAVEQLVPLKRFPVPGTDYPLPLTQPQPQPVVATRPLWVTTTAPAPPGTQTMTFNQPAVVTKRPGTSSPAVSEPALAPLPQPLTFPSAPATARPMTNTGTAPQPLPAQVVNTSPTSHFVQTATELLELPAQGASANPIQIAQELARVEKKSAAALQDGRNLLQGLGDIADIIQLVEYLTALFEKPLAAKEYTITGVCETVEEGEPQPETTVSLPTEAWSDRLISALDALPTLLQAHLIYKTPICGSETPNLEGEFRTISFRSDDVSPYGKSRLRKRLKYRSVSGLELDGVVDHWRDFSFEAGSVCVKHLGSSWGTITVWASTADEGKRVIRHAAGEAGINPDQDGRWQIGGSNSPRLGVSGTMRVDTTGGYYWITVRDGSNGRPIVVRT